MKPTQQPSAGSHAGKYLTVTLAEESYGVAVLKVREIIRLQKITPVPQMPAFINGVINLRGRVVPVIDLRVKFGLEAKFTDRTCIVVVNIARPGAKSLQMGLIVDSVEEVVHFTDADIAPTPDFGTAVNPEYLLGMAKAKDRVKTLLDIDRAVSEDQLLAIAAA